MPASVVPTPVVTRERRHDAHGVGCHNYLPQRLRDARRLAGLRSRPAAERVTGISEHTLRAYEDGVNAPSASKLARLARAYDVSVDYLLGLVSSPQSLPVGKVIVDQGAIEAVLSANTPESIRYYLRRHLNALPWITEVPENVRVLTISQAMQLRERLVEHVRSVAPELVDRLRPDFGVLDLDTPLPR